MHEANTPSPSSSKFLRYVVLSLSLLGFGNLLYGVDADDLEVVNYDYRSDGNIELRGRLFVPDNYDAQQSYPIVVFFHGAGERGTNNVTQVEKNIDNLITAATSREFFVYAPQLPPNQAWNSGWVRDAFRVVGNITGDYNIDISKIYATGLSLGGGGVWNALDLFSGILAGSVPLAGVSGGVVMGANTINEPIWVYHAVNDGTVGVGASRTHVNEILAANGQPTVSFPLVGNDGSPYYSDGTTYLENGALRYSEYSFGNHGIWNRVYGESQMYDWMLAQESTDTDWAIGDSVLIDLGNRSNVTVDSQSRHWNATSFGFHDTLGTVIPFAKLSDGGQSTLSVSVVDAFSFHSLVTYNAGSLFDEEISNDGWGTVINATETVGAGSLAFTGLLPGGKYKVEIYAYQSNDDGGRGRMTRYKIGTETRDLEPHANLTNTAVFAEVTADITGQLDLKVFPTPTSGSRYGHISTIQLTLVSGPNGPINAPPVVFAGDDQAIVIAQGGTVSANLSGSVTDDGLPSNSLMTLWAVVDSPLGSSPAIADTAMAQTSVTFDAPGDYTLQLTGNDTEATRNDVIVITVKLEGGPLGGETVFSQDFESSSVLTDYIDTLSPSIGDFEDIGADTGGGTWAISALGKLEHVRDGGTGAAGFQRVSGLGELTFTRIEFELYVDGTSNFQDFGEIILGNWTSLFANSASGSNAQRTFSLTMKSRGAGKYYLRMNNDAGNFDTPDMSAGSAPIKVIWYTNMSGESKTYNGPDGFGHTLVNDSSDLWVDDVLVLDGIARRSQYTGTSSSAFRFRSSSSQPLTLRFDDFRVIDQSVEVVTPMPFQEWLEQYFTESERNDVLISGDDADPDLDGISNLLEYAFQGLPLQAAQRGTGLVFSAVDGQLNLIRRPSLNDLTIELWGTEDLSNWELLATSTGGAAFVTSGAQPILITDDAGDPANVSIEDPRVNTDTNPIPVFYRLDVSRTP
ncbi:hypothetical protein [Rubellicoccus peritrichatus]|uniref:PKD/Chitinase domain-containing protein n=1 Tax=Rubellicoccus peritrichatus TaxID=3080537 RepID=A0AAQ3LCP7_9BACT|nr:hypothetical protein [Puniceicoccus sp. CR14]WOO43280.1 hypothetical protein RZN69_09275 [Puniceicoccus sp. CR14]